MEEYDTKVPALDMYTIRNTVGDFFEKRIADVFGFINTKAAKGNRRLLDLSTKDSTCAFECKAGLSSRGAVIIEKQIHTKFQPLPWIKLFYVFAYHKVSKIQQKYETKEALLEALDENTHSYHIMPDEVVSAYFNTRTPRSINTMNSSVRDRYVPMPASKSRKIFDRDPRLWSLMGLDPEDYRICNPHKKVFITTQSWELLESILEHFDPAKV